jgi:hypothetical protein
MSATLPQDAKAGSMSARSGAPVSFRRPHPTVTCNAKSEAPDCPASSRRYRAPCEEDRSRGEESPAQGRHPPVKASSRYVWTSGETQKESMATLRSLALQKAVEAPTTVPAPMISLIPPLPSARGATGAGVAGANDKGDTLVPAAPDDGTFPDIQRAKYKFSCQFLDGSLQSKTATENRQRAEYLMNRFNVGHDKKIAFYKKYRNPDPSDEDYDAFAAAALGPFDLQRAVTELDFHNLTESALFDSHYAEILTLFTDDSFVKALSVGGEVDKELLRVRSKHILLSGGSALQGMGLTEGHLLRRSSRSNMREENSKIPHRLALKEAKAEQDKQKVDAAARDGGPPVSTLTKRQREQLQAEMEATKAKMALQSLFSAQLAARFSDSGDDDSGDES